MASFIQKMSPHFSLAKWILCSTGLIRYLHPTDDELKTMANIPRTKGGKSKGGKSNGNVEASNTFHVPRSMDIQLKTTQIDQFEVLHLRYFTEYQWLVDFSLYTTVVYCISEVSYLQLHTFSLL